MDLFLRIATLLLFVLWRVYWLITEKKADSEKPKSKTKPPLFSSIMLTRYGLLFVFLCLLLQLLHNVPLLPMPSNLTLQLVGFALVILGLGVCIVARRELDTNWANAWEYQIKQKQKLVTSGVYKYIRHPIYTGVVTAVIGAEMVAQSYLFIVLFLAFWVTYKQAKLEEGILEKHFGKEYTDYKKRSKMLIPFIF